MRQLPKSIEALPEKHRAKIADVSDERNNSDGWWVYLTKKYADFQFDPQSPTRQIHEQSLRVLIDRLRAAREVTESDYAKFPDLER